MFSSDNNPAIAKIRFYFGFFIVGLYFVIGFAFLFTDVAIQQFPTYREAVGCVLLVYGAFRAYSIVKANKKAEEEG
jgi:hypothetical protein